MTSHDVVARVRRLAGTRKVGHAGTLDPMATGVLVLGIDRATRLLGHLMLTDKAYDATVRLGAATTTDDAEGEVRRHRLDRRHHRASRSARRSPASSATSSRSRRRCRRSRSTASGPTTGSAPASRSSCSRAPVRIDAIEVHEVDGDDVRHLGAVLERHLHPGHRPRPGRAPRGRAATWSRCGVRRSVPTTSTSRTPWSSSRTSFVAAAHRRGRPRRRSRPRPRRGAGHRRRLRPQAGARPRPRRTGRPVRAGRRLPRALRAGRRVARAVAVFV